MNELIAERENLISIAIELYGPDFYVNEEYWVSGVAWDLYNVEQSLTNLGWKDDMSPEEKKINEAIYKQAYEQLINPS